MLFNQKEMIHEFRSVIIYYFGESGKSVLCLFLLQFLCTRRVPCDLNIQLEKESCDCL
jgi:hypothetical protein